MSDFNVLTHNLIPEHHLMSEDEAQQMLSELNITRDQLPKIRKGDACIKVLERIHGPIEEGRIIRIVRKSDTAESFEVYRLVIKDVKR
ncbi:MAG: DNA-directed RNA polymerase subunit H [Euryarchaeota archaeon]|nr:DNA-directed RNA polymerase subunit H [Euryarchaeota archaeon]